MEEKMKEQMVVLDDYQKKLAQDLYRPTYHFAIPGDKGVPFDPNGAFFADGVYHLMYLYRNSKTDAYHWGHLSSIDLVHWRYHADALSAAPESRGYYSGGAFLDDDGTAYLTTWKLPDRDPASSYRGGIVLARAKAPYEVWEEMPERMLDANDGNNDGGCTSVMIDGELKHLGCADPSNLWKADGYYYIQLGNKVVLDIYGFGAGKDVAGDDAYKGDWTELFRSKDLKNWEYRGRFYKNPGTYPDGPDETEDDMCPSFLPLYDAKSGGKESGKWLQLFISHNKGCQYYVGTLRGERFIPELHGRMTGGESWTTPYFAPEALVDDRGRQIIWTWLRDNLDHDFDRFGWTGVYSFPRTVWWEDGVLRMAPAEELSLLQYHHRAYQCLPDGIVPVGDGASFRIIAEWDLSDCPNASAGFRVRCSDDGREYTDVVYDAAAGTLSVDTTHNGGAEIWKAKAKETAPFALRPGEPLRLDVFVDRTVVEVYANERQAICRRTYPADPAHALGVRLFDAACAPKKLDTWDIFPANPY